MGRYLLVALLLFMGCDSQDQTITIDPGEEVVLAFSKSGAAGFTTEVDGLTVTVTAFGGEVYRTDFGDNSGRVSGTPVSHTYEAEREYVVKMRIDDSTYSQTICVGTCDPGDPPPDDDPPSGDGWNGQGGVVAGIGMSNGMIEFSAIRDLGYRIKNYGQPGRGLERWALTDDPWDYIGETQFGYEIVVFKHATVFPGEDTCDFRFPCHEAMTVEEMIAYEVDLYGLVLEKARAKFPDATRFVLLNRTHNFCDTDQKQQNPEPYAAATKQSVEAVAALHADVETGPDLHVLSLEWNNPGGDPATADCAFFRPDGTHPSDIGAEFVAQAVIDYLK